MKMFRQVLRGRNYSDLHALGCRCSQCYGRHPNDAAIKPWAYVVGLGLLVLAIAVTL
jgi:hypothetical protein